MAWLFTINVGPATWSRLGELATQIYAQGFHREQTNTTNIPHYVLETRRRIFAASYRLEKSISTFLGRPPLLCLRHSNCRLPLDTSDESICSERRDFDHARTMLDDDGWNVHGEVNRSGWIRLWFILSTYREEILDCALAQNNSENGWKLM